MCTQAADYQVWDLVWVGGCGVCRLGQGHSSTTRGHGLGAVRGRRGRLASSGRGVKAPGRGCAGGGRQAWCRRSPPRGAPRRPPAWLQDWWWKARLGKCYYQLGLLREAEKQLRSSIKQQVRACAPCARVSGKGTASAPPHPPPAAERGAAGARRTPAAGGVTWRERVSEFGGRRWIERGRALLVVVPMVRGGGGGGGVAGDAGPSAGAGQDQYPHGPARRRAGAVHGGAAGAYAREGQQAELDCWRERALLARLWAPATPCLGMGARAAWLVGWVGGWVKQHEQPGRCRARPRVCVRAELLRCVPLRRTRGTATCCWAWRVYTTAWGRRTRPCR